MHIDGCTTDSIYDCKSASITTEDGPFVPPSKVAFELYPRDVNVDPLIHVGEGCVINLDVLYGDVMAG